jgi:hypothetical protein
MNFEINPVLKPHTKNEQQNRETGHQSFVLDEVVNHLAQTVHAMRECKSQQQEIINPPSQLAQCIAR